MSFYSPVSGSITPNIGGSITAVSDTSPVFALDKHCGKAQRME
jgi:hypothetical protein